MLLACPFICFSKANSYCQAFHARPSVRMALAVQLPLNFLRGHFYYDIVKNTVGYARTNVIGSRASFFIVTIRSSVH